AIVRCGQDTSDSTLVGYVKNWLNLRYKETCSLVRWPWLQDNQTIRMISEYTTGTVACTTLATSVTGTSTAWTKAMTDRKFKFTSFEEIYRIAQWSSATGITLADTYNGSTVTADTYTIFQDEYLCPIDWGMIKNIRDSRNGNKLEFIALNVLRADSPNSYPSNSDPDKYSILETRDVTRIDFDSGSGTFAINERVDCLNGDATTAYGNVKKVGSSYLYIQILYGTFKDNGVMTGSDSSATASVNEPNGYTEGNIGGTLKVIFDPAPYRNILYNCEIIKKPVDLSEDTDEPLIPEEFRDCLYYLTMADIYGYLQQKDNRDRWEDKGQIRITQMISKYRHLMDNPRIRPAYSRVKYV
ncbi:MAG: hypothetical protein ACFE9S_07710, partial [Candidatus Hermodarchaeota archaeon]